MSFRSFLERIAAANEMRRREDLEAGRALRPPLGIAPELKHPSHHLAQSLDPVPPLFELLAEYGYRGRDAPVWIQSFEVGVLRRLRARTELRLLQLVAPRGRPPDLASKGPSFAEMLEPQGLAEVARYADAIGVPKSLVLEKGGGAWVRRARTAGLEVHVWTFRAENRFLDEAFRRGGGPAERGDLAGEVRAALERCVDAAFVDHPFLAVRARDAFVGGKP